MSGGSLLDTLVAPVARPWMAAAVASLVGAGAVTGWGPGLLALAAFLGFLAIPGWKAVSLMPLIVLAVSPLHRWTPLEPGPISGEVVVSADSRSGRFGDSAPARLGGSAILLELPASTELDRGSVVHLTGHVESVTTLRAGRPHQLVDVSTFLVLKRADSPYARTGKALRSLVSEKFNGESEARALLAGFLVGDTSGVSDATQDAMKLSGLSHFVAVSGSNVALFLATVYLMTAVVAISPKIRATVGLVCLPVFVVATGFEPSVLRAAVMAGVVLVGRLLGIELDIWQVLAVAVSGLMIMDPWLVRSVGFQLSVAATAGVILGSRWPGTRKGAGRALAVTSGAQLAVAPLLLAHFGSIPLLSPISNLLAAPLVSLATVTAIPAVFGFGLAADVAETVSGLVIGIAHTAAAWPQISWLGFFLVAAGAPVLFWARKRPAVIALALLAVTGIVVFGGGQSPEPGSVTVLDVGQGDAILLAGGLGGYALVDGGPDEAALLRHLRSMGVRSLNLVVMTHGDADHASGLAGLFGRIPVGALWERTDPHTGAPGAKVLDLARSHGVPIINPSRGDKVRLGSLEIEVLGPIRRYQSPNDQSIVVVVSGTERNMLLSGDIEVVAQRELPRLEFDVLKVPHHGGGTSDPEWLTAVGADLAVISVGANTFGHPVGWVVATLEAQGAVVRRTDRDGSVSVDLDERGP